KQDLNKVCLTKPCMSVLSLAGESNDATTGAETRERMIGKSNDWMGSEVSRIRMEAPLKELLKANGTPLKTDTCRSFLRVVETLCPWFIQEGLLNIPQWEHLGDALRDHERDVGPLPKGTLAVWKLVQSCLVTPSPKFEGIVTQGTQALMEVKDQSAAASEIGSGSGTDTDE
ncbi:endogenous retrovirus group K member 5 Gag polyprotein-like isoform X1, partial [Leptotrombidium deliense]